MPLAIPVSLRSALTLPVAVFGGGVSGEGVCALARALGVATVVYDARGREFTSEDAGRHALAVYSPGFAPGHPWLARARAAGLECLAELDFASLFWVGRAVAVTGTNGKTTLTEFLAHALRSAGRCARAAGNIGFPLSRLAAEADGGAPDAIAVCEVSSFQAESLRHFRAGATLWTNFAEDHLERHASLEAYFAAKWELVRRTAPGHFFAGSSVARFAAQFGREIPASARVETEIGAGAASPVARDGGNGRGPSRLRAAWEVDLEGTVFARMPQLENFLLAAAWWRSEGWAEAELLAAARSFRLGRHRLAPVAVVAGATYWNDSKATNFHAAEAALAGFAAPVRLIAGGKSKGGDLTGFVARAAPRVKAAYLLGETKAALADAFAACAVPHRLCASVESAVEQAAAEAEPGDQILLSPGFSSLDMFRSYEERGDRFEQAVRNLGESPIRKPALARACS